MKSYCIKGKQKERLINNTCQDPQSVAPMNVCQLMIGMAAALLFVKDKPRSFVRLTTSIMVNLILPTIFEPVCYAGQIHRFLQ